MMNKMTGPTTEKQRYQILDLLRGFFLIGIALANFPEFALWSFLSPAEQAAMPTAAVDRVARFVQYLLVDGKFYTIFSLLFGVGFSLILARHGRRLFVRRMLLLMVIGFLHLMFIWSGDILLLYAVGGLLLTLFVGFTDRQLAMLFRRHQHLVLFRWLAAPGRMALSNYISQSLLGVALFYGLGLGLGTSFGFVHAEMTALACFVVQTVCSLVWLRFFLFGPLEWLWRMLTYGRYFPIKRPSK